MRLGTVLDVGVRIVRRHWAVLLGLAAVFVGPGALLTSALASEFFTVADRTFPGLAEGIIETDLVLTDQQLESLLGALLAYVAATLLAGVIASIGALGFSAVVAADYHHRAITFTEALRVAIVRAPSALVFILVTTAFVIGIAVGGLLLIVVVIGALGGGELGEGGPGVFAALVIAVALVVLLAYLTMRWAPALPVLAIERRGWRATLARSWELSGDNVWRIFVVVLIAALVTAVLAAVVTQLLSIVLVDVVAASMGVDPLIAEAIVTALGAVLFAALAPVWLAVLYFDLRDRRDPAPAVGLGP